MSLLSYLEDNDLPCRIWLDSSDLATINISGNTFTWTNKIGISNYDFIQTTLANHPTVTSGGISFESNQNLQIRNNNVFSNAKSYSIVLITKQNTLSPISAIQVGKNNPSYSKFIDIEYDNNLIDREFSLENLTSSLENTHSESPQQLLLSHYIQQGLTSVSLDANPFQNKHFSSKGNVLDNLNAGFYLGNNSLGTQPFTGRILHFLLFSPAISDLQLFEVASFVNTGLNKPTQFSNEFDLSNSFILDIDINLNTFNKRFVYTSPIVIYNTYASSINNPSVLGTLTLAYVWDEIISERWDVLTETDWNNILKGSYP